MWPAVVGLVGSIAGSIGSTYLGSKWNHGYNEDLMYLQQQLNAQTYQNRHQWTVSDLKAAGLNPMLSATTGVGVPGTVGIANVNNPIQGAVSGKQLEEVVRRAGRMYDAQIRGAEADATAREQEALTKTLANMALLDEGISANPSANSAQAFQSGTVGPDGVLNIGLRAAGGEPLWKVEADARRALARQGVRGKKLENALRDVEFSYRLMQQDVRQDFPGLVTLEVFGNSAKSATGPMKDLGLTLDNVLNFKNPAKKAGRRR